MTTIASAGDGTQVTPAGGPPAVLTEGHGPVLLITLNRPEARNAVNMAVTLGLGDALERAEHDPAFWAVVVTGAGDKAFCAGADLKAVQSGMASTVACVWADAPLRQDRPGASAYGTASRSRPGWRGLPAAAGISSTNHTYAMAARRHMERYGTTSERLGAIAVAQRDQAALNPLAQLRTPITIEDYLASQWIAEFFDGTAAGQFLVRHCTACGGLSAPQATQCEHCSSTALDWRPAAGGATLVSWTIAYSKPDATGKTNRTILGIAELAEGPWWWSQIVDADPTQLRVGAPLRIGFERHDGQHEAVPVFALAADAVSPEPSEM